MKKHWKKIAVIFAGALLVIVLLLPMIASRSGLLAQWVNRYSGLDARIDFETASLGWFSPVRLGGVQLTDNAGTSLAAIEEINFSRSLYGLLMSGSRGLELQIRGADIAVRNQSGSLNWLHLTTPDPSPRPRPALSLAIQIADSRIRFFEGEVASGTLEQVSGQVGLLPGSDDSTQVIDIQLRGDSTTASASGPVELTTGLEFDPEMRWTRIEASITANQAPLASLNPVLACWGTPRLCAVLDGRSQIQISSDSESWQTDLRFEQLRVSPDSPEQKQVFVDYPVVPFTIDGQLVLNVDADSEFNIATGYGSADFRGRLPLGSELAGESLSWDLLLDQSYQVNGKFDFARFASDFPEIIQVKSGVELQSGEVAFTAFSRPEGDQQRFLMDLRADQLLARAADRQLNWKEPLQLSCALKRPRQSADEVLELEFIQCQSDFLSISGAGQIGLKSSSGKVTMDGDLALLKSRLSEFFELHGFQLSGQLDGTLSWKVDSQNDASNAFEISGTSHIEQFQLGFPPETGWSENRLDLVLNTRGLLKANLVETLENVVARLSVDADEATFELRNPVRLEEDYQAIFDARLAGSAANWMRRVNSLFDLGFKLQGETGLTAVVSLTPKFVRVRTRQFNVKPFDMQVASLQFSEPIARGEVDLTYLRADGSVQSNQLQVVSPNVTIAASDFSSRIEDNQRVTAGDFQLTGSAEKIGRWFLPTEMVARGPLAGNVSVRYRDSGIEWQTDLSSTDFDLQQRVRNPETRLVTFQSLIPRGPARLQGSGVLNDGTMQLGNLTITARQTELAAAGLIDFSEPALRVDLTGRLNSDFEKLLADWAPQFASQIRIVEGQAESVTLQGPVTRLEADQDSRLLPSNLTGSVEVRWTAGEIFALPLEAGSVQIGLADSALEISPRNLKVAQGELVASSKILLEKETQTLLIPAGTVIRQAEIGPEVFRTWMRYVTPFLADATRAEGKFSILLDEDSQIPMANPLFGKIRARMDIDSVRVGPGPLGQSLIGTTSQILTLLGQNSKLKSLAEKPWLELPRQSIRVSMDGGRVAHQQLTFRMGEVTVQTTGFVDQNQNINITMTVPIAADWFEDRPLLKSIVGEAIQIPLQGNLAEPRLDREFLRELYVRLARGAADNLLDGEAGELLRSELLKSELFQGDFLKNNPELREILDGRARDLLKKGIFRGLDQLRKKEN